MGGAIVLSLSHAVINNNTFEGNGAKNGGAIFSTNSCIEVNDSAFIVNIAVVSKAFQNNQDWVQCLLSRRV